MPAHICRLCIFVVLLLIGTATQAQIACQLSNQDISLGQQPSFSIADAPTVRGESRLSCGSLINLATYGVTRAVFENIPLTLQHTSDANERLPVTLRAGTASGQVVTSGLEINSNSVQWFAGNPGLVPLFANLETPATRPDPKAGLYTGTVQIRWYWNVCTSGVLILCLAWSTSPGATPGCTWSSCDWGQGVPVTLQVSVRVTNDCIIDSPRIDFGSAPLLSGFRPVVQNINIICTRGSTYDVALSDGYHSSGGQRRMRGNSSGQYLAYEIYRSTTSLERWGMAGTQVRSSREADVNPTLEGGVNGAVQQFTYRAEILQNQPAPTADTYRDNVVVNILF